MTLTARDIAEITRLLEDSTFDELELEIDGLKIHLKKGGQSPFPGKEGQSPFASKEGLSPFPSKEGLSPFLEVRAPLLGTFYRAPKPGAPPFVEPGASVEPDTVVGIIEVMKLMNAVRAGMRGVVREIRARDGTLVEYGETLLLVEPQEPS
ncbi:MAG TPA: biotin/lipoyl-containing protein [Steroidobacteraceae bacterium]|nr:biotin/lipoyl-containing protein [Steroidobacteraceae bacterium]